MKISKVLISTFFAATLSIPTFSTSKADIDWKAFADFCPEPLPYDKFTAQKIDNPDTGRLIICLPPPGVNPNAGEHEEDRLGGIVKDITDLISDPTDPTGGGDGPAGIVKDLDDELIDPTDPSPDLSLSTGMTGETFAKKLLDEAGIIFLVGEDDSQGKVLTLLPDGRVYELDTTEPGTPKTETAYWWADENGLFLGNERGKPEISMVVLKRASDEDHIPQSAESWNTTRSNKGNVANLDVVGEGDQMPQSAESLNSSRSNKGNVANLDVVGDLSDTPSSVSITWTEWLNRDGPSGRGDYESISAFIDAGSINGTPSGIECRTRDGVDWEEAGQVYVCNLERGGICVNEDQREGRCLDYEVRFAYPAKD